MFAVIPTKTVNAAFSKSVSCMSSGLNSTLQPMSLSIPGGTLNLKLFQLVDYRFSKWLTSFVYLLYKSHAQESSFSSSVEISPSFSIPQHLLDISFSKINSFSYAGIGSLKNRVAKW